MATISSDNDNAMERGEAGDFEPLDSSMSESRSGSWFSLLKGSMTRLSTSTLKAENSSKQPTLQGLWNRIKENAAPRQSNRVRRPAIVQKCKCLSTKSNKL
jgi:hypothetical protein